MRTRVLLLCTVLLVLCAALSRIIASPTEAAGTTGTFLYTAAKQYEPLAWMRGGERFPLGATIFVSDGKKSQALVSGFFATADPDLAFDGKSVVFAGKKTASSPWQIWEIAFPGGEPRQIVKSPEDAVRPLHLPDDVIAYAQKRNGRFVIESTPISGGKTLSLTFTPASVFPTDVLRDGRILFQAGYPLGTVSTPEIYTLYADGSGVESYRCDHAAARYAGRQISTGDIVFTKGRGLAKFTSPIAHEVALDAPAGEYAGDVVETPSGEWLLAWRADAKSPFELKKWKPGANALTPVAVEAGLNLVQPIVAEARAVPNRHPSGLHDWTAANLMALSAYTSKYKFAEGSIASVKVYTQDKTARPKLLGTAPVEKDGSFFVHVPGDQPIKFELVDKAGKTLQKENGWMWARGGEQRICVGCHAGPERAPENAVPAVLQRSTDPVDMTATKPKLKAGGN